MIVGNLWLRARIIQGLRHFFLEREYLETDTPVRLPSLAPEAYLEPEPSGAWFLQTSPELCMKRLLAAGIPKLFQICKCFRRQERGDRHLPEFTMLEWYRAGCDYHGLMADCEDLLRFLAIRLGLGSTITVAGQALRLDEPWERITVAEAFRRYAEVSMAEALANDTFDEQIVRFIEPALGLTRPTFLYDYPAELGSLARLRADDPAVAERFELYIAGLELANGFSELTEVAEQGRRFQSERARITAAGRDPGPLPDKFLAALATMPEAAGIALGVDRLVMILCGAAAIDQVVAFTPEEL